MSELIASLRPASSRSEVENKPADVHETAIERIPTALDVAQYIQARIAVQNARYAGTPSARIRLGVHELEWVLYKMRMEYMWMNFMTPFFSDEVVKYDTGTVLYSGKKVSMPSFPNVEEYMYRFSTADISDEIFTSALTQEHGGIRKALIKLGTKIGVSRAAYVDEIIADIYVRGLDAFIDNTIKFCIGRTSEEDEVSAAKAVRTIKKRNRQAVPEKITVERFIDHFRGDTKVVFTQGCCYWFAQMLVTRFASCGDTEMMYDEVIGHFGARIGKKVYDISGDITDSADWTPWGKLDSCRRERIIRACFELR